MSSTILNPLIPVGWSVYKPNKETSLCSNGVLLDGLLPENWDKHLPRIQNSREYLDPENWPLTIPALSNLNKVDEVDWSSSVITPELQLILDNFGKGLMSIRYKKANNNTDYTFVK